MAVYSIFYHRRIDYEFHHGYPIAIISYEITVQRLHYTILYEVLH